MWIRQRWILVTQAAEPTEQMGIAVQLRQSAHSRKVGVEIGKETTRGAPIVGYGAAAEGGREGLDAGFKDLLEFCVGQSGVWGRTHRFLGKGKRVRFCTARAYSRQTSWGASCT